MSLRQRVGAAMFAVWSAWATLLLVEGGLRAHALLTDRTGGLDRAAVTRPPPAAPDCKAEGVNVVGLGEVVRPSEFADLVYELKPDIDTCAFWQNHVTTNHAGQRGRREHAQKKAPGVFRIVGVGDSYMFGQGVDDGEPYVDQLEKLLRARGVDAEVISLAVPGYNTAQEAAMLERRGMPYQPDLILVGYVGNDMGLPNFLLEPPDFFTAERSYLWDFVLSRLGRLPAARAAMRPPSWRDLGNDEAVPAERVPEAYRYMVGLEGFQQALDRLQRVAGKVPVLAWGPFGNPYGGPDVVEKILAARGIHLGQVELGLLHTVGKYDLHPNAEGHALIAQRILERLASDRLVPGLR